MKKVILAAAFGSAMLFSGVALADGAQTMQATPAVASSGDNAVVCRQTYHEGTLIKRQTCLTRAQWNVVRLQDQKDLRDYQLRSVIQKN